MLAIQVKEKKSRAGIEAERDAMVLARERDDNKAAEAADQRKRAGHKAANERYALDLKKQMAVQDERKVLEPFLMSKAEREMNATMLRRLP